jgi:hypothetical protein
MTHPYEMKTIICQDRLRTTIRILKRMGLHFTQAKDDSGFRSYAATMPWPSLPYKVRKRYLLRTNMAKTQKKRDAFSYTGALNEGEAGEEVWRGGKPLLGDTGRGDGCGLHQKR